MEIVVRPFVCIIKYNCNPIFLVNENYSQFQGVLVVY
jgi:hypothetical protein